jgi:hypothetical protein
LFSITDEASSMTILDEFRDIQKGLFESLGLCFRYIQFK